MNNKIRGLNGHWVHFTSENSPLPVDSLVTPFVANKQGQIWLNVWISRGIGIRPDYHGLFLTDGSKWLDYKPERYGIPDGTIEYMAVDSHNSLWLSILNVGVCCLDGQSAKIFSFGDSGFLTKDMVITDFHIDKSDRVWVATMSHGTYVFSDDIWKQVIAREEGIFCKNALTFGIDYYRKDTWLACVDENETLFLSNHADIWRIACSLPLGFKHTDEVSCFIVDQNGHIWAGTREGGLTRWNGKSWNKLTKRDCSILYGEIESLKIDEFNNMWVGTSGGFAIFDGYEWQVWGAITLEAIRKPVSREELVQSNSQKNVGFVYIGSNVVIDSLGRKWLSAPTGIVMFSPF